MFILFGLLDRRFWYGGTQSTNVASEIKGSFEFYFTVAFFLRPGVFLNQRLCDFRRWIIQISTIGKAFRVELSCSIALITSKLLNLYNVSQYRLLTTFWVEMHPTILFGYEWIRNWILELLVWFPLYVIIPYAYFQLRIQIVVLFLSKCSDLRNIRPVHTKCLLLVTMVEGSLYKYIIIE